MTTTRQNRPQITHAARTLGLLLPLLVPVGGLAGAQASTIGDLPFQVTAPAPAWVRPGLRLTFYHASSTTPHGDYDYKVDENGDWVDKRGTRYSREKAIGTGSHGLIQANIVGMDQHKAATQMLFFLFDGMNFAEPTQKIELGYSAPAATGGDLWLHPQVLEELLRQGHAGLNVRRIAKTIDNATYDGVLIHCSTEHGKSVWIYDRASGVLLYSSQLGTQAPTFSNTGARTSKGGATAMFTIFKGSRYPEIPWKDAPAPEWLAGIQKLDYQGHFAVRQQGIPDTPFPFSIDVEVKERGHDWLLLDGQVRSGMPGGGLPGFGGRATGRQQLCGFWIPVQGLKSLRPGQELDNDPMTKVVTRVNRVDGESVTISQLSPRQQLDFTYRLSDGLLVKGVFAERFTFPPGMANVLEINLTGAR